MLTFGPCTCSAGPRSCHTWAKLFKQEIPRVASCNGRAWNMQPAGREPFVGRHTITQNKPDSKATQTTQTQQTNEQHRTKQHKTNTTKQDKANQTTKPNQAKRKHTKPNPNKARHDTIQQTGRTTERHRNEHNNRTATQTPRGTPDLNLIYAYVSREMPVGEAIVC